MLFQVKRVSDQDDNISPCDEGVERKITCVDYVRKIVNKDRWYSMGSNHRKNADGTFSRDIGECTGFFVEINTIEELWNFQEKYGELIIGKSPMNERIPLITIYDDYIE